MDFLTPLIAYAVDDLLNSIRPVIGIAIIVALIIIAINEWRWSGVHTTEAEMQDDERYSVLQLLLSITFGPLIWLSPHSRYTCGVLKEARQRKEQMRAYRKTWPEKYR